MNNIKFDICKKIFEYSLLLGELLNSSFGSKLLLNTSCISKSFHFCKIHVRHPFTGEPWVNHIVMEYHIFKSWN